MNRIARRAASIAWPAFLAAGVLEIAVFAFVDPQTLHTLGGSGIGLSDTAVLSLAFLVFWVCTGAACGLTVLLERSATDINAEPPPSVDSRADFSRQSH